jgi:H+/Cl- antiporter ClcA
VAGGAAGIAAAFNTPLGGVMFAIEELSRTPEQRSSGLLMAAIVLAGLMAVSINGNATYFGLIHATGIDASLIVPGLMVAVASGGGRPVFALADCVAQWPAARLVHPPAGAQAGAVCRRLRPGVAALGIYRAAPCLAAVQTTPARWWRAASMRRACSSSSNLSPPG